MKRILLGIMVLSLTACATAAQRQANQIQTVAKKATEELKACITDVEQKPDYETIAPHLFSPANGFHPTMQQLADDTYPTKRDSQLIIKLHDDVLPCRQSAIQQLQSVVPTIAEVLTEEWVESDQQTMKLVKRKTTWGESARQTQQLMVRTQKKLIDAAHQIDSGLAASHQAEMAQRQAASNALMEWSVQQQMINSMNRPTITNCNAMGNSINCVSNK